ncbi:ribose 5-phosphate isomerase A [Haloferax sp. wsp5]|nr:ribose 5-phosphate isomerase A [Haloferax sp. wsp5]
MKQGGSDAAKQAAGESAAEAVEDATVVGLGTGSTAAYAIRAIGQAVDAGLDVVGVPTSFQSRQLARDCGIPLADLDDVSVDLAIDGADEVASGNLIKGGGAAHAREKIVDASADRFLVVADPTKEAAVLSCLSPSRYSRWPARPSRGVSDLGGEATLRRAERKDGPVVTDNGNLVLDCEFGAIPTPPSLATDLARSPVLSSTGCSSVWLTRFTSALRGRHRPNAFEIADAVGTAKLYAA